MLYQNKNSRIKLWVMLAAGCLLLAAIGSVPAGSPAAEDEENIDSMELIEDIPVMVTFRDAQGDMIKSDGLGPYIYGDHNKYIAVIRGHDGSLDFGDSFGDNGGRKLFFDFNVPLDADDDGIPDDENHNPEVVFGPDNCGLPFLFRMMASRNLREVRPEYGPQETSVRFLIVIWNGEKPKDKNAQTYEIMFFPPWFPQTHYATVTGGPDIDGDGFSDSWEIETFADDVANLRYHGGTQDYLGSFHMPFHIDIEKISTSASPDVAITSPTDGASFTTGATIDFAATANDPEDGDVVANSLIWTSDIDGEIGYGDSFYEVLSDGIHTITATATDSDGNTGSDTISITVGGTTGMVFVSSIDYTTQGGKDGNRNLTITISLMDDNGAPVVGAEVSFDIFWEYRPWQSLTETSGADGTVSHTLNRAKSGYYTTTVNNVLAPGLIWDGITPENSYVKQ